MARPSRCRRVCSEPDYESFVPEGIACGERNCLTLDEFEAIRLIDLEKFTHEQCAKQMDISRTTVTEIYESARGKIADSIVNGKALHISGGNYRFCDGTEIYNCSRKCMKINSADLCQTVERKGENAMRIAVTYENGEIFQHFGHSEHFKVYDVEDGRIVKEMVIDTNGNGHGALAGLLSGLNADVLICGGIGGGARNALAAAGIELYGGVSGNADEAVKSFIGGSLTYNPDVQCSHHDHGGHGHDCGGHGGHCGEDRHGCAGNGHCGS
ncbi:MAG TPA: DUF134 domain-containing protein [Candidatus Alectryocaccobium stercorigallinarum]|nr:DUF134 domain-containing protein [Candidatus Alectryocaccobium stercorigallinarum]